MAWVHLFIAAGFEISWAIGLKYTDGFTRLKPTLFTILTMLASFYFLSLAVKALPVGTAYAIWTGIGAVGVAALGILLFAEPLGIWRMLSIGSIVVGIVGLKLTATGY